MFAKKEPDQTGQDAAAVIESTTPEQVEALDALNARIGAGEFADDINAIVANAYGF